MLQAWYIVSTSISTPEVGTSSKLRIPGGSEYNASGTNTARDILIFTAFFFKKVWGFGG